MADAPTNVPHPATGNNAVQLLFGYRGRIGRSKYWIGLAVALISLLLALVLAGQAMSTTGGRSGVLLAVPFLLLFVWIQAAVTTKRLRDAGLRGLSYLAFVALPFIAIAVAIEFIAYAWQLIPVMAIAVLAIPGLLATKTP